jgi:hypothetical protein
MITRALVPLLLALLLVGALVQLSCVAAEHGTNSPAEATRRLVTDVDPPSALEIEGGDAAENATGPFLTR